MSTNRFVFHEEDPRFNDDLRLSGIGIREIMPSGFVSRRRGIPAFLLILFHDPATVLLNGLHTEVSPGTLVVWEPHRPHHFGRSNQSWSHSWILFSGQLITRKAVLIQDILEQPMYVRDQKHLLSCFDNILREFKEVQRPDIPIIAGNIDLILREVIRGNNDQVREEQTRDPVEIACQYIRGRISKGITVPKIAAAAGLSPSRLQQIFHARHTMSIMQYVEQQRLQEARYWLVHSGLRISEVAQRAGYTDSFYFSRRFRIAFGHSPREYRKLHEEGNPFPPFQEGS